MKSAFALSLIFSIASINAQAAKVGEAAPTFTLKDVDGKTVSLKDFAGKAVVLEWINFDCPFVKKHYESGNMPKLQKTYGEKGVAWLAIASSKPGKQGNFSGDEIKKRLAAAGSAPTAYLIDEKSEVAKAYGAKVTPHMYVIDPKGLLAYNGGIDNIDSTDAADIPKATPYVANALDEVLANKKVTVSTSKPYGCGVKY